jgi:hypothetical protein
MGLHEAGEMLHGDFSELEPLFVDAGNSGSDVTRVNAGTKECHIFRDTNACIP